MTQYIKSYNIANNSIKSFVFDSSVANTFNAAGIANDLAIAANVAAQAVSTFVTLQTQQVAALPPTISTISITDSSYNVLGISVMSASGGYLKITGSNFQSGAVVVVGSSNTALTTTLVDSSTITSEVPSVAPGTYPVYVVNTSGGTGIKINGLTTGPPIKLYSWGRNTDGDLGQNDLVDKSSPTQVGSGTDWNLISTGQYNSIATKINGTLWTWGKNHYGQSGLNDLIARSTPTQIGTDKNWKTIDGSTRFNNAAIKTNGTLWTWGRNTYGELGLNGVVARSSPTQVGTDTNWLKSMNTYHGITSKTDGTLWLVGRNNYGQLGLNDVVARSSPVQLGTGTNWSTFNVGIFNNLAIKTDGTLWAWGMNQYGANLGLNNKVDRSSPTQVGALTTWLDVTVSGYQTMLIKTDGTLWTCGRNENGSLGLNLPAATYRSSPVQVGAGTTWLKVLGGAYKTMAISTT